MVGKDDYGKNRLNRKQKKRNSGVREAILFMKQEQDAIKIDGSESKTNVLGN